VSAGSAATPARRKPATTSRKREVAPAEPVASLSAPADGAAEIAVEVATEPSYQQIAILAYALWEARGCQGGNPEDDWFAAEQQLRGTS